MGDIKQGFIIHESNHLHGTRYHMNRKIYEVIRERKEKASLAINPSQLGAEVKRS
jgi:hypothetical protein